MYFISHADQTINAVKFYSAEDLDHAFLKFIDAISPNHPAVNAQEITGQFAATKDHITWTRDENPREFWFAVAATVFEDRDNEDFFVGETREEAAALANEWLNGSEDEA